MIHHCKAIGFTFCFAAVALFLTTGCAGSLSAGSKSSSARVVVLDKSLVKLKEAFNAEPSKTKVLAICRQRVAVAFTARKLSNMRPRPLRPMLRRQTC